MRRPATLQVKGMKTREKGDTKKKGEIRLTHGRGLREKGKVSAIDTENRFG